MKTKTVIILIVVILMIFSLSAIKKYVDNSVRDKYGMVRTPEEEIVLCRYSCGGGMDGSSETLEIRMTESGKSVVTYDYSSVTSDKEISETAEVSADAIKEIRDICKKYRIFSWGELRKTEEILLDAPITSVYVSTGEAEYSYNSNHIIPEYGMGITTELYNSMIKHIKGVD